MTKPLVLLSSMLVGLFAVTNFEPTIAQEKQTESAQKKGDDEKSKEDKAKDNKVEVVQGQLVIANKEKIEVDFAKSEIVLEEEFIPEPPELPKNWDEMSPEEQEKWATEFLASEEGKAYEAKQTEQYEKRRIVKIVVDDKGKFSLKDVPPRPLYFKWSDRRQTQREKFCRYSVRCDRITR